MRCINTNCNQNERLWLLAGAAILTAPFWLGRNNCCNGNNNSCCGYNQYNYNPPYPQPQPYYYPQPYPYPYPYPYPA